MYFHSLPFLAFLILTFALYWAVHRHKWARLSMLMLASLVFYAAYTPLPLLVFFWCAAVDYVCIRGIQSAETKLGRKLFLIVSVSSNLSVLSLFKYGDLFYRTVTEVFGSAGVVVRYDPLNLIYPLGLSFVVFRAISLTVDVYRGQVKGRFSYFEHLLYLLFFPLIVSGPIVRASDLLEKFGQTPKLQPSDGANGLYRIAVGIVKKLVIADVLAAGIVDPVFGNPAGYTSAECAVAAVAYTLQLYFDFSGYSDIAIGAAALFGFKLPENFDKPYLARNLFEFWNRWHISLSTWLRDYLYIPLGGNRVSKPRVLFNLMVVMALGGLWHGADWRFAVWGAVHGVALAIWRIWWWVIGGRPKDAGIPRIFAGWLVMFIVVVLTRVIFRADNLTVAWSMYEQMLAMTTGLAKVSSAVWIALVAACALHGLPHRVFDLGARAFVWMPAPARAVVLVALGLVIRQVGNADVRPYIYAQF